MEPRFVHDTIVIGIPAYNEEGYIAATIASLRAQTHADFLAVVLDNASTDGTEAAARAAIGDDARFIYHRQSENVGGPRNFQYLPDNSRSPFIMWLGGHDLIVPEFLSTHIEALRRRPECSLSYSHTRWIDDDGNTLRITRASDLVKLPRNRLLRYLRAISWIGECTAVNSVIRRSMIGSARLRPVAGGDIVFLAHLLHAGPACCDPSPRYLRRAKGEKREDYMTRVTGRSGVAYDFGPFRNAFRDDAETLAVWRPLRPLFRLAVRAATDRIGRQRRATTGVAR